MEITAMMRYCVEFFTWLRNLSHLFRCSSTTEDQPGRRGKKKWKGHEATTPSLKPTFPLSVQPGVLFWLELIYPDDFAATTFNAQTRGRMCPLWYFIFSCPQKADLNKWFYEFCIFLRRFPISTGRFFQMRFCKIRSPQINKCKKTNLL